jgi:hypothetical protein
MVDELGRGIVHECKHRKLVYQICEDSFMTSSPYTFPPYGVNHWDSGQAQTGPYSANVKAQPITGWNLANDELPYGWSMDSLSSIDENRLKEDVIEASKQYKADLLLDLVEANQMWPSITSLATSLPKLRDEWQRRGRLSLSKTLGHASGSFLAWKFGIAPVISDMMAVHRYLPRFRKDVKRLADRDASRYSRSGVIKLHFSKADELDYANGNIISRVSYQGRQVSTPTVRYVLVVKPKQKYTLPFFQAADNFMRRFATSPASLAWEKVPFSFVIDWFVDLRGVLRTIDNMLGVSPDYEVSFTRSFSYALATDQQWSYYSPCGGGQLWSVRSGSAEYKHYERKPVSSQGSLPAWIPQNGKNHAAIAAALITQQLLKLRSFRVGLDKTIIER